MGVTATRVSLGRVLILVENLSVPFDRRVWQESLALTRAGFEVVVLCPRGEVRDQEAFEVREGVEIHRFPLQWASGGPFGYAREYVLAFWQVWRHTRRLARERPFDVVHACNPPDFLLLAARGLRRGNTRFIFDHHDLVPEMYLSRFKRGRDALYRLTLRLERMTFRLADVVIATNESYRQIALARGRKPPGQVFVVRSAPDLERFRPIAPDPRLKRGRSHLLAYLGVMGPQDGIDYALRSLSVLRERRSDWHAVFIGDGDVAADMRRLASDLGLDDFVEFTGRLPDEDVIRILSTADVGLAPDPKDPFTDRSTMNKILEYMALSRPIVSNDLVEARVSAGEAALYAEGNDEQSFARCIDELLDEPERRAVMGAAGRARLEERLSWKHSEAALLEAYRRALASANGAGRNPR